MPSSNSLPTITTVLTAALLLLTSVTSGAKEVKPPLFPDGLKYLNPPNLVSSQVVPKLVRVLPSDVPAACYSAAASPEKPNSSTPNCAVSDLEVLEVTYPDCEEPWIMCRCSNANISRSDMMRQFGGLSPNLRGAVKNVIVFKAEDAASGRAYARNQEVIFFGDVFDWTVFTFVVSSVYNLFGGFSKTPEYQRAVHEDTCAADSFAASVKEGNYGTPWAQVFIINSFKRMGGVLGSNATCLQNQLDLVAKQTDDFVNQPRCDLSRKAKKGPMIQRRPDEKLNPEIDTKILTNTNKPSSSVTALKTDAPAKTAVPTSKARNNTTDIPSSSVTAPKTDSPSKTAVPISNAGKNTEIVNDVEPEVNGAVRVLQMLGFSPLVVCIVAWAMV